MLAKTLRAFMLGALVVALLLGSSPVGLVYAQAATATPTPDAQETPVPEEEAEEPEEATPPEEAIEEEEEAVAAQAEEPDELTEIPERTLALTVYNQDLGLVKDLRPLELEAGINEVRFSDVPSGIDATSVHLSTLGAAELAFLEQNYEYDLVSSRKLLQKYVDQTITLTTTEGQEISGTLLSGADDIVLATEDGIRVIRLDQVQQFAFPALPEGLITRPTLVWLVNAATGGTVPVQVTYLTSGITWRANYVAMLSADDDAVDITGWVTVDNRSGATYPDAKLKLVAGEVNVVQEQQFVKDVMVERELAMAAGVPAVTEREFFEYHIYEVERPVTVRDNQTKQIEFVQVADVPVEKVLVYEPQPGLRPVYGAFYNSQGYGVTSDKTVQVRIEFMNSEEGGLGIPLPKGVVRVFKEDIDGGAEFVGEDAIDHTPKDELISLLLGEAFDVVGERVQTAYQQRGDREVIETIEITIRNHKAEDITVHAIEHLYRAQDSEITAATLEYELLDASTARFLVEVEAEGEATFEYTVHYRW